MIRQKIEKKHTPYVKYKYLTQVPCRLNVRVSKAKFLYKKHMISTKFGPRSLKHFRCEILF